LLVKKERKKERKEERKNMNYEEKFVSEKISLDKVLIKSSSTFVHPIIIKKLPLAKRTYKL